MKLNYLIILGCILGSEVASALVPSRPNGIKLSPVPGDATSLARPAFNVTTSSDWAANVNVAIYTDATCTNNIGSAPTGRITNNVTIVPNRDLVPGSNYRIYARAFEIISGTFSATTPVPASACSTTHLSITRCPYGYVAVKKNSSLGTAKDFCVMKYEARGNGGGAVRGGHASSGMYSGIYSISLLNPPTFVSDKRGFRCVYRP